MKFSFGYKLLLVIHSIVVSISFAESADFLYYVSEEKGRLEVPLRTQINSHDVEFSARPYNGFVVRSFAIVKFNGKYSVQFDGELLEKDWPSAILAAKVADRWFFEIEKEGVGQEGKARLLVHGLTEEQAKSLGAASGNLFLKQEE